MSEFADDPVLIRSLKKDGFIRANSSFLDKVGFSIEDLAERDFFYWIEDEDQEDFQKLLNGEIESCFIRHKTEKKDEIKLNIRVSGTLEEGWIILARFVPDENNCLELDYFPEESNVKSTLHEIAQIVEEQNPGYKCSILLVEDGRFVKGAGPSLPDDYNNAIDGFAIGPTVGSCGTAIYWNIPVIVTDIQKDPLWEPFAELAKKAGVCACWSHPFSSRSGRVLGALAFYSTKPESPSEGQLRHLRASARMTGLAVERGRAEDALREKHKQALELEEQLRQAAKMEALGVLAGGVAHDFNNVLATILANVELSLLMLEKFPNREERNKIKNKLEDVVSASHRAGSFCNQMLSYAGRGKVSTKKTEIRSLISELNSLVLAALSKKTVLEFALDDELIYVNGDENQLLQVIMNLITNAAEAIKGEDKEGKIIVSSKVKEFDFKTLAKLSPEDDLVAGPYVSISVSDNGSGMDQETKSRIFDPFYTTKSTGRGLGLSAVKGIIKMHKGVIFLESELSVGTTFTVLLPVIGTETNNEDVSKELSLKNEDPLGCRVLFIDDEKDLLLALAETLEYHGYDVVQACDGQEAIEIFRKSPNSFDCVLTDLSMPKLSGQEVAEEVYKINNEVPVVLMSGYNESELSQSFDEGILAGSLQKPVAIDELIEMINSVVGERTQKKKAS